MKPVVIIILVVFVMVAVAALWFFLGNKPDYSQYDKLKNPAISQKPAQNMLVVFSKGDPSLSAGTAIKALYKTYYSLKGIKKSFAMAAPRARWSLTQSSQKDEMIGLFGLPVPMSVKSIPPGKKSGEQKVYLAVWTYGLVAEILHTGPYDNEMQTIKRLTDYITQQGYKINGDHEEEYIKGPGMFGPGNPDEYLTIIRYRVEKIKNAEDAKKIQKQK